MRKWITCLALTIGCGGSEALEAGDCPGTPRNVAIDPVAPFNYGLVSLTFESDTAPGSVELQRHSTARAEWEQTYGALGQEDDGTFVVQVRPQLSESDADEDFKLRVRSTLLGCPPSAWAESDGVSLGDPVTGTTWVGTFGPGTQTSQISVSVNSGAGSAIGPYRLSTASPLRHTFTFAAGGVFSETFELTIQSATSGDLYNGCHFKLAYQGGWISTRSDDSRVALFDRRFMSMAGSTCASPPVSDVQLTPSDVLSDEVLSSSNIDYSRLRDSPAGRAEWQNYSLLQQGFSQIVPSLSDFTGADTASLSGYINVFDARYVKQ